MTERRAYSPRWLALTTLLLLVIAASRILRLGELVDMASDEIWSIWQTLGTPEQILQWTPYDWPPLGFLVLGGWRVLVGLHPVALRMLSVLVFMLALAITFRLMRRLGADRWGGLLGVAAYAALGYAIFVSLYVRGYALVALYAPLALWLTMRYFARPTFWRALPLGITLAAMFLTTLSTMGAFLALGLFSLIVYRQQIWRWWLPGLIAGGLAAPEILNKFALGVSRVDATSQQRLPPLPEALGDLFSAYTGNAPLVWVGVVILATLLILFRRQLQPRTIGILAWVLTPIVLYAANAVIGLFSYRYTLWVMAGLALWVALGLAQLPRPGQLAAGGLLCVLMFLPIPLDQYEYFFPPLGVNMPWLAEKLEPGDVLLIDPNWRDPTCDCDRAEEWHYYAELFFPQGLEFVDAPEGHPRVWYVTWQSRQDQEMEARVNEGRVPGIFVGPPENLIRLYEGPPDPVGITFEPGVRFHGLTIPDTPAIPLRHEGEPVNVRLWWSADTPLEADYSISLQVFYNDELVFQQDGPIAVDGTPLDTSRWTPGEVYPDDRTIQIPYPAGQGDYIIKLTVYQWWDNERLVAPGADENRLLTVGRVYVKAW